MSVVKKTQLDRQRLIGPNMRPTRKALGLCHKQDIRGPSGIRPGSTSDMRHRPRMLCEDAAPEKQDCKSDQDLLYNTYMQQRARLRALHQVDCFESHARGLARVYNSSNTFA